MTSMPLDNDSQPIPVLTLRTGGGHAITFSATSDRTQTDFAAGVRVVQLTPTSACFVAFGNASVVATGNDHYMPAGVPQVFSIMSSGFAVPTRVAAIQASAPGTLYVSELV